MHCPVSCKANGDRIRFKGEGGGGGGQDSDAIAKKTLYTYLGRSVV